MNTKTLTVSFLSALCIVVSVASARALVKQEAYTTPNATAADSAKEYGHSPKITPDQQPYANFVADLSREVISVKKSKLSEKEGKERLVAIAKEYVNIESIAKFLLASKYRQLNSDDKQKFIKCVTNLIATRLLAELPHGESIKTTITNVKELPNNHCLVTAQYEVDDREYTVVFSVFNRKSGLKVFDIIIDQVSASKIQRADIDGKIAKDGFKKFLADFFKMYGANEE